MPSVCCALISPAFEALDRRRQLPSLAEKWTLRSGAIGPKTFDCGAGHRNSSPGAYGAYPFIDFDHHYFGILARQGKLGTFREGDQLFGVIAADVTRWADACSARSN